MQRWSKDTILDAIRTWYTIYQDPPCALEWEKRSRPNWCPSTTTVKDYFGSFNKAIEEAGFIPRQRGHPSHRLDIERYSDGRFKSYSERN